MCRVALLFSFKTIYESKTTTAEADVVDGLIIFTNSKPVSEYTIIGNVRTAAVSYNDEDYIMDRDNIIEKCKKT